MNELMLDVKAGIETYFNRSEYKNNHKTMKNFELIKHLLLDVTSVANTKHPMHDERLADVKLQLSKFKAGDSIILNFGDSLTHLAQEWISSIDVFASLSGSWSCHIRDMMDDVVELVNSKGLVVRAVVVGCNGGNPLLAKQEIGHVIDESLLTLQHARKLFPLSRIVYYGLPPVYAIYAAENSYRFDMAMLNSFILKDFNACMISLKKNMGSGFLKLFPTTVMSSDAVHFTPRGARKFSKLVHKAVYGKYKLV